MALVMCCKREIYKEWYALLHLATWVFSELGQIALIFSSKWVNWIFYSLLDTKIASLKHSTERLYKCLSSMFVSMFIKMNTLISCVESNLSYIIFIKSMLCLPWTENHSFIPILSGLRVFSLFFYHLTQRWSVLDPWPFASFCKCSYNVYSNLRIFRFNAVGFLYVYISKARVRNVNTMKSFYLIFSAADVHICFSRWSNNMFIFRL